jgi:hypothetical protein
MTPTLLRPVRMAADIDQLNNLEQDESYIAMSPVEEPPN